MLVPAGSRFDSPVAFLHIRGAEKFGASVDLSQATDELLKWTPEPLSESWELGLVTGDSSNNNYIKMLHKGVKLCPQPQL